MEFDTQALSAAYYARHRQRRLNGLVGLGLALFALILPIDIYLKDPPFALLSIGLVLGTVALMIPFAALSAFVWNAHGPERVRFDTDGIEFAFPGAKPLFLRWGDRRTKFVILDYTGFEYRSQPVPARLLIPFKPDVPLPAPAIEPLLRTTREAGVLAREVTGAWYAGKALRRYYIRGRSGPVPDQDADVSHHLNGS